MNSALDELLIGDVTDVLINGPEQVWVCDMQGLRLSDLQFGDEEEVRALAVRFATMAGRSLDDAHPYVDFEFEGLRIHAVLPPLAPHTHISIRRMQHRKITIEGLFPNSDISQDLRDIVESKRNFLISGGTGAGKTTLLSSMISAISATSRVAVIEDTKEISALHPHVISLQSRMPNSEGKGEVTLRDLVRQSLRMRPDRIFVGEVRGAEVIDLLAALNTGHAGSGGTLHANSAAEVPTRIESMAIFAGIPADAARRLFFSAIDVVVHLRSSLQRGVESIYIAGDGQLLPLTSYSPEGLRL